MKVKDCTTLRNQVPPELTQRLAALFHDVGKALTRTEEKGKIQFLKHAKVGAAVAHEIMRRLTYSNDDIAAVERLINLHMDTKHGKNDASGLKDSHLCKLINRAGDLLEPLLNLIHADNLSCAPEHQDPNQINQIRKRIDKWNLQSIIDAELPIDGKDIMELGAKGRLIGYITKKLREKWLERGSLSRQDALQIAQDIVRTPPKDLS